MRRKNQILALGLAAVLTAASAVPAFAGYAPTGPGAEPEPEKYDAATLSKLQDNVLEYDELALRVREYNRISQRPGENMGSPRKTTRIC